MEERRTDRKRRAVVDAARETFLAKGYDGSTMDEVTALAGVSKATVYNHFPDKQALFVAVVTQEIDGAELGTTAMVEALGESDDIARDLRSFARRHVVDVLDPRLVRLRRMVVAEAERFPALAEQWYSRGPERGHVALARQFVRLHERGVLRVEAPILAAQHLNYLVQAAAMNVAMFRPGAPLPRRKLHELADAGVRVFLAAYAP